MSRIAYTSIVQSPNPDGKHYRLVVADESGGYSTLKETGAADDPFYVAKGPIWFATREAAEAEAARRNERELHLSEAEIAEIIAHSVRDGSARRGR